MKSISSLALVIVLLLTGLYFLSSMGDQGSTNVNDDKTQSFTTFEDETLGLRLEYRVSPAGYTIIETEKGANDSEDFVGGIMMMRTDDYIDMQTGPDRGGPPTMNIRVLKISDTNLERWLVDNSNFTNYTEESGQATIGGIDGLIYTWEGMFNGETAVVLYNGLLYMFEGMSHAGTEDTRRSDFRELLKTVEFLPPSRLSLSGTFLCIGDEKPSATTAESCISGIRSEDGLVYSLDFMLMSQIAPELNAGDIIHVSGVFTPTERLSSDFWMEHNVTGILSVTSMTKE